MSGSRTRRRSPGGAVRLRPARGSGEVEAALALRRRVFCDEQGVARALEFDGRDGEADHIVAVAGGRVVGTCRLLRDGDTVKLGRMAVARERRGEGIAARMLELAEQRARAGGARRIALHAQTRVRDLYERAGYVPYGDTFDEAGIEHVAMERRLA